MQEPRYHSFRFRAVGVIVGLVLLTVIAIQARSLLTARSSTETESSPAGAQAKTGNLESTASAAPENGMDTVLGRNSKRTLWVRHYGPASAFVGETTEFVILLENKGSRILHDVKLTGAYDPEFELITATRPTERRLSTHHVSFDVPVLNPGERRSFQVKCKARATASSACGHVTVKASSGQEGSDSYSLPILPARQTPKGPVAPDAPNN
jgi:hypothetical protein